MLVTPVVVVVPSAVPAEEAPRGDPGPLERAMVTTSPRMITTTRVVIMATPRSEARRKRYVAAVALRIVCRTSPHLSKTDATAARRPKVVFVLYGASTIWHGTIVEVRKIVDGDVL
jgi:hypothetical protein